LYMQWHAAGSGNRSVETCTVPFVTKQQQDVLISKQSSETS